MSRKLKVFGGVYDGMNRLIVATPTKKAAYEAISRVRHVGAYSTWITYTSETGNTEELTIACGDPGIVFSKNVRGFGISFVRLTPREAGPS